MCFISPASCPKEVVTRSLRNYVECGGLTPLSAAQLDATQVARGGSGALGSKSSAARKVICIQRFNRGTKCRLRPNAARQAAPKKSGVKPPHSI